MRKILSLASRVIACATLALYYSVPAHADDGDDAKQELEQILADWGAWKDLRRELASSYVINADAIRLAMCDGDEEEIQKMVEDAEKKAQGDLKSGYEKLEGDMLDLLSHITKLEDDPNVGEDARKWRAAMVGAETRLARVKYGSDILRGVDNAKVRARIDTGIKKHKEYQENSSNCTAYEVEVPVGTSYGRIDCVKVDGGYCEIIEIKPDNDKARAKGLNQLKGYVDGAKEAWKKSGYNKEKMEKDEQESKAAVFTGCIDKDDNQELRLRTDVVTYEFCPVPQEDIDAMIEEMVAQRNSTADD